MISDEINDLTDQLGESGRRVMEMEKAYKRLEMERDQVHATLEETEALVGQEQGKLQRLQVELSNAKTETERRLAEKDEEMENVRSVSTINVTGLYHGLGRPTGWAALVGSRFLAFWWVGLGRWSETFPKILKLDRPLVTAEVIPDNLIMINADK